MDERLRGPPFALCKAPFWITVPVSRARLLSESNLGRRPSATPLAGTGRFIARAGRPTRLPSP